MLVQSEMVGPLIEQLEELLAEMVSLESSAATEVLPAQHELGARNLLHYVALRRHDLRDTQRQLASLGLSSLGRTESHVLPAIRAVLDLLYNLDPSAPERDASDASSAVTPAHGRRQLDENTEALLGAAPDGRRVRIMVTMPSEAAGDYGLVRKLVEGGMNCMRINCAHDGPEEWAAMIANLRRAEAELDRRCVVEMDVAGPKLRTGEIEPGPAVLKCRPTRDDFGRLKAPARIWLTSSTRGSAPPQPCSGRVPVSAVWLNRLEQGQTIYFTDARGAKRSLRVCEAAEGGRWAEASSTCYLVPSLTLTTRATPGRPARSSKIGKLPPKAQSLALHRGDTLVLTRAATPGRPAALGPDGEVHEPARIGVTLPEFFECVHVGEPIWFDDGNIGGIVSAVDAELVEVNIVHARREGDKLGAEKGINIPATDLRVSSLTAEDREALAFVVEHADIVGFSFVRSAEDVAELRRCLADLGRADLGIVLKIETRRGFANLPQILMEAMKSPAVGVMIARGDLAVECGYQRLAELQEEILWIAEAAHVPVVWATQVLETLAKTGRPSRSEITDAAMGERAECVMLNKGPYVTEAVRVLDDILRRMEAHQEKKTPMLRRLNVATAFAAASPGHVDVEPGAFGNAAAA